MKICVKCKTEKEESEFSKKKGGKDGLRSICKQCCKDYNAQYQQAHKAQLSEYRAQWREANKDYCKQYDKQRNTQRISYNKSRNAKYYLTHKKEISEKTVRYRKEHPDARCKELAATRGLGFKPLNNHFKASAAHHLHLENSKDFLVYILIWDHGLHKHNPKKPETMTTINAIALDYWINESLYNELFKP